MITSQFNPFRFYLDKRARQCEKTPEDANSFVFYNTGELPMFQVMVDYIYTDNSAYSWRLKLYDDTDAEVTEFEEVILLESGWRDYRYVTYSGDTIPLASGNYYYLLYNDLETYYSDVFVWTSDIDKLLKVSCESSPISVGGAPTFDMASTFSHTFYLNAEYLGIKPKIEQDASRQDAIDVIIFGDRAITREFEIDASDSIYIFLSALGLINTNGLVQFTFAYETFTASDIVIEEKDSHGNGLYQLKLSFVDQSDTVGVVNE